MTAIKRHIAVVGQMADLPKVTTFVDDACQACHVDPAVRFVLQLAVEEACTNVIEHAYAGLGGEFEVTFETRGRDVVITVHDHGRPFDPTQVADPDFTVPLEERPLGGLGLYMMEHLMDEVRFTFSPLEGNTLVMIKSQVLRPE